MERKKSLRKRDVLYSKVEENKSITLRKLNRELTLYNLRNSDPRNQFSLKSHASSIGNKRVQPENLQKKMTFEEVEEIRKMKTKVTNYDKPKPSNILTSPWHFLGNKLIPPSILDMTDKARSFGILQDNLFGKVTSIMRSRGFTKLSNKISEATSLCSSYDSKDSEKERPLKLVRSKSAFATLKNYMQCDKEGKILSSIPAEDEVDGDIENPLSEVMLVLLMHYIDKIKKPTLKKFIRRKSCCCSFCGKPKSHKGDFVILKQDLPSNLRQKPRLDGKKKRQGFSQRGSGSMSFLKLVETTHKNYKDDANYGNTLRRNQGLGSAFNEQAFRRESRIQRLINADANKLKELVAAGDYSDPGDSSDGQFPDSRANRNKIPSLKHFKNREMILKKIIEKKKAQRERTVQEICAMKLTPRVYNISEPKNSLKKSVRENNKFIFASSTSRPSNRKIRDIDPLDTITPSSLKKRKKKRSSKPNLIDFKLFNLPTPNRKLYSERKNPKTARLMKTTKFNPAYLPNKQIHQKFPQTKGLKGVQKVYRKKLHERIEYLQNFPIKSTNLNKCNIFHKSLDWFRVYSCTDCSCCSMIWLC
ncbi:unnamed protein product [Moneuplotes crassus]|uniref:Uncharacterized protein n=1 Tax=Euplotes crassus TaxID=5936 RepID=A0AAD1YAI5_EUPCR|nr:unnamed protein product [Moneuplotes crassus]